MTYLVIVDTTPDNKIAKMQKYSTKAEADTHIARVLPKYPNAFVVDNPAPYVLSYTTVDVTAKTITYNSSAHEAQKVEDNAQDEIQRLEATITPRRLRDALASDAGKSWVAAVEAKIATERGKL